MKETKVSVIGSNAGRNRSHNRRVILDYVRSYEPAGRAEIARQCGLSVQAVSNITEVLEREGLLHAVGQTSGARGKPAIQYRFDPEGAFAIGIEIRPDALICAILNLAGDRIYSDRVALSEATPDIVVPLVGDMVLGAVRDSNRDRDRLLGVGIVMPGPFGSAGPGDVSGANLPGWSDIDTKAIFEAELDCPVIVENDATAAAISERVAGVASSLDSFCFIYFGTGLGLGVIMNGHAQRGAFGNIGEIGHVVTKVGGAKCSCGNYGCLEVYASRMSAKNHLEKCGIELGDGLALTQLMRDRDPALTDWINIAAAHLSRAVGIVENLFDPEAIIFGGAMPDMILDELIARLDLPSGSVSNRKNRQVERVIRGSSGRLTAALGGAAIMIHETITPAMAVQD